MNRHDHATRASGAGGSATAPSPADSGDDERYRAAGAQLDALADTVRRERAAVAALDAGKLAAIAAEKQGLVDHLRHLLDESPGDAQGRAVRGSHPVREIDPRARALREATTRVLADAEANVALLTDAIGILAEALGMSREAGTYDARARLRQEVRPLAGTNA